MKIVILYSGGLDSFILRHYAIRKYPEAEVKCIYFKHGSMSQDTEIRSLPDFVDVRTIDWLNEENVPVAKSSEPMVGAIYVPGRNLVFAVAAAAQELPDEIWLGAMANEAHEGMTDKNMHFVQETNKLLNYVLSPFIKNDITIRCPFVEEDWVKSDSVGWALSNGIDRDQLLRTNSCWYNSDGVPCGECKQCLQRHLVMISFGITEQYKVNPMESSEQLEKIRGYIQAVENGSINRDELEMYRLIKNAHLEV